ncbi:MAG: HAD family hydrolase [Coriobacteriales bacterium]|nr:HAD family hydrolase [Coriobacteriales bacterium]
MEEKKTVPGYWRVVAMAALCVCALLVGLLASRSGKNEQTPAATDQAVEQEATEAGAEQDAAESEEEHTTGFTLVEGEDPLSLWADDAPLKKELVAYVEAVTDESSPDFIPVENRIATFDVDGTLLNETDPNYFDYTLLVHRVLEDPDYKDKASDFEKSVANKIVDQNENGTKYEELPVEHGQAVASAFAGMTVDEFYDYVHEFAGTDMPSYEGMKRGESFYQPMVQVVQYLQANGFDCYMMSGTDRLIMRGLFSSEYCPIEVPLDHILGSDESLVGSEQGDEDGLDYTFSQGEELVLGGDFYMKTLKENKCYIIEREIAKQPVLSFGNSSGDFSMHNYALSNPDYKSAAFQLCCDDVVRENGNLEKGELMRQECEENGYVPVSMANDWTTIYGDGVTYTGGEVELAEAA